MSHQTPELFTESAWGGLPQTMPWTAQPGASEPDARWAVGPGAEPPQTLSYVETLGFPRGTPTGVLAKVLEEIRATAAGRRVERLLSPGMLSPLFSQSAAEASYALAILSIVESRDFETTLARLRRG